MSEPHTEPITMPSLPGRDELAERCRQAWFHADNHYPIGRRWFAVADAILASVNAPPAEATDVDEEIRLLALAVDLFADADKTVVARICHYLLARYATFPPQAF